MPKKRKGRRARGTGSIFFHEGRGVWVGRRVVGRTPDGTPIRVERSAPTQGEVVELLAAATPPGPDVTVGQWVARWYATLQVRDSTAADYRQSLDKYVLPEVGHLRLCDLTPGRVEAMAVALARRGLGANTIRQAVAHLGTAMQAALRDEVVHRNPVRVARRPKAKKADIDPFTPAELKTLVAAATARESARPLALLAATGCRVGEALALDVTDFDPVAGTVSITKTYDREFGIRPPKSANGVRTIRVPKPAMPALVAAAGRRKKGPLFLSSQGTRRVYQNVSVTWKSLLKRCELRYRKPHQLRHSVATALIADGEGLADVAKFLGDTLATLVKTYVHPTYSDPCARLDRLLGP